MTTSYRVSRLLAGFVVLVQLVTPLLAHAQEKLEKIRIGYPTITPSVGPWWIAKDGGNFWGGGVGGGGSVYGGGAQRRESRIRRRHTGGVRGNAPYCFGDCARRR